MRRGLADVSLALCVCGCASVGPIPRLPSPPLLDEGRRVAQAPIPFPPPSGDRPVIAIVIDDLGDSIPQASAFAAVPIPLTLAILPDATEAPAVAQFLKSLGRETLIHIPMEPEADAPARVSFLSTSMSDEEIVLRLSAFLERVPGAVGANNHMGSRFTTDAHRMEVVLRFLHERGLFFLDSRTTPVTTGRVVAARVGIPFAERHVFLDHEPDESSIEARLEEAVRTARQEGCAIAIGHPKAETLEVLMRWAVAPGRDVDVVPVSHAIAVPCRNADAPPRSGRSSGNGTVPPLHCGSRDRDGP